MAHNLPRNMPQISPYLYYADVGAALEWLSRAFGFRERVRVPNAEGKITHAEMQSGDGVIMMGNPGPAYKNPRQLGAVTQSQYVYVPDVDNHFAHAKESGAVIIQGLNDQPYGDRTYGVEDLEGHRWYFAAPVRG